MFIFIIIFCFFVEAYAGDPITIDGLFQDWENIGIEFDDPDGDGFDEDFSGLKITNDNDFLFLKFGFNGSEQLLQDFNGIRLYIDVDNNSNTGRSFRGIGADIEWCFGCRSGSIWQNQVPVAIRQNDLTLRSAPTITSRDFEIAVGLFSQALTLNNTQIADTLAIVLATSDEADYLPDNIGGAQYIIDTTPVEPPDAIPLARSRPEHLRILSYNTLGSGLSNANRQPAFERIIKALSPDIMAFQEQRDAPDVEILMSKWLQPSNFHSLMLGNGNMVVSRFPILNSAILTNSGRTMVVLLNTADELGVNLLVMNSHLSCCANDVSRQRDADEIIMRLREWRDGSGPFQLPENTPMVHLGDFNLVGSSLQIRTLTHGDISDESNNGEDFAPDWDGSSLTDLFSRQTSARMGYTWRNDNSAFSPGKLDYFLFTDSILELGNHYVLNTLAMSADELSTAGLLAQDTNNASDHLPRIIDIAGVRPVSVEGDFVVETPRQFFLYPAYPNPFNPSTTIRYSVVHGSHVTIRIFDVLGREVGILLDDFREMGDYSLVFDAAQLVSGVYFVKLAAGGTIQTEKILLMK